MKFETLCLDLGITPELSRPGVGSEQVSDLLLYLDRALAQA
jgi:hypothetical protein